MLEKFRLSKVQSAFAQRMRTKVVCTLLSLPARSEDIIEEDADAKATKQRQKRMKEEK